MEMPMWKGFVASARLKAIAEFVGRVGYVH
jgi:hypothetical protein